MMKATNTYTSILALGFTIISAMFLTSCRKDAMGTIYRPNSDDGKEIHFSVSQMTKSFPDNEPQGIMELSVVRPGTKGEQSVYLTQMGVDESMFSFPEKVTIKDGEYRTVVPVLVELSKFIKGSSYSTSIYITGRDQSTGNYGVLNSNYSDGVTITAEIELEWAPLWIDPKAENPVQQTAMYTYDGYWHGKSRNLPVEKAVCDEIIYRVNQWGTNNTYFMWQVKDDNTCVVPKQNTGTFNSTYSQYIMFSDYPTNGTQSSYTYKNYPCTYDGDRTFTFNLIYYREGSTGNFGKGVETLVFESKEDEKASVDITYEGVDSTSTGFIGAKLRFRPNDFTLKYNVFFYEGKDTTVTPSKSLTLYEEDRQSWNLSRGPHTIKAIAYDANGEAGDTTSLLFTFDPDSSYCVKVNEFTVNPVDGEDASSSLQVRIYTQNLVKGWRAVLSESDWETVLKKQTEEEYLLTRTAFSEANIKSANSSKGLAYKNISLKSNTTYTVAMLLENEYGERMIVRRTSRTAPSSTDKTIDQFDRNAKLANFLGSYLMTASVGDRATSAVPTTFRIDISRMDDNRVIISGLASPIVGYEPVATAYFDSERHCLVLDTQDVGTYTEQGTKYYSHLSFYYTKSSSYYNVLSGTYLLGIVDGEVIWVTSPDASYTLIGYSFIKCTGLPGSKYSTNTRIGNKVFINPSLQQLERYVEE